MTRRHVLNNLYSLDLITREAREIHSHQLSPPIHKGKTMAVMMHDTQDNLERQQRLDDPKVGRVSVIRSLIKSFIVCVLGIAVILLFCRRIWAT